MHFYKAAADLIGTADAHELAARIAAWHDAMVHHARAIRVRGAECDDDCPHAQAGALWAAALEVFGDHAWRFTFLQSHGASLSGGDAVVSELRV